MAQRKRGKPGKQAGFTLLELMITVAIIGILAAVALSSYQGYITNASATKVQRAYSSAENFVRSRFVQAHTALNVGAAPNFPTSVAQWISEINPNNDIAPGGGAAFVAGTGDTITGSIGIQYSGTFLGGDAALTITRPSYAGVAATSVTVTH